MTGTPEVPLSTIEVYYLDDILSVFPDGFETDFHENFLQASDISYGDAEYTLVRGAVIDRLLHDCWDEGDYESTLSMRDVWNQLPVLFDGEVLVAISG